MLSSDPGVQCTKKNTTRRDGGIVQITLFRKNIDGFFKKRYTDCDFLEVGS